MIAPFDRYSPVTRRAGSPSAVASHPPPWRARTQRQVAFRDRSIIIYALIIEVVPQYDLIESCEHVSWDTIRESLRVGTPFVGKRAVQVVVSQFKHNDGTRPAFLTTRVEAATTKAQSGDPLESLYPMLARISIPVLNGNPSTYPDIIKGVLFQALKQETKRGWAHTVMSSSAEPPAKGLTLEVAFDATSKAYLGFVDAALRILDDAYQFEHLGWGGWFSLRFQGHSRAYLAPQHQSTRTCTIEFAAAAGLNSTKELLRRLEVEARAHGGIQHWGMFDDLNAHDVAKAYPRLDTWRQVRWDLTNGGTVRTFDNDFTNRCKPSISPTLPLRGWSRLGNGLFNSGPAVASMAPNRLDVFARGTDDRLYTISWTGSSWNAWRQLAPEQISSDPAAVSWGPGRIDMFARGTDKQMYTMSWDGSKWTGWSRLGDGLFNSGPAVASMTPNRLDVFARGTDDRLYTISWAGSSWTAWRQLAPEQISSDPAAVSWGSGRIDVFARGTDNQMYKISWDGSKWTGWSRLGDGLFNSGPAVASMTPNRLDVFARGTDDRLYTISGAGSSWNAWRQLAPEQISSDPAAVSWGLNRIDVFARGTDNQMYTMSWDGTQW